MDEPEWTVIPADTHEAWLELLDPEGMYRAGVRFDGCIHFWKAGDNTLTNAPIRNEDHADYIHICDVDEMIARLQSIKARAKAHFGDEWPR